MRHDKVARQIMGRLSKNGVGCNMPASTPTTMVGIRIIHGANAKAVIDAIARQRDWKPVS